MIRIFTLLFLFLSSFTITAQSLDELSFGTDATLEIVTWNIEWFPKNDDTTLEYVIDVIEALDVNVFALQEIHEFDYFDQLVEELENYDGFLASSGNQIRLAYIYNTDVIEVNSIYEIYTGQEYWRPFPRRPLVMDFTFMDESYIVINNHLKSGGDGILDYDDPDDDENRRYVAMNLLKDYVEEHFEGRNVIITGDLNDEILVDPPNNVFQSFLDDPDNYLFADYDIAAGSTAYWSFPSWPSHLDHIIINSELFDAFYQESTQVQTLRIEDYLSGGWFEYYVNISDHRPVAIKFDPELALIFEKDFEDQSLTSGGWTTHNIIGEQIWGIPEQEYGHVGSYCAYINGYSGGANENENWFISPEVDANIYENLFLSFWNASGYSGPQLQVFYSVDFDGDPTEASWVEIQGVNWHDGESFWEWTYSGKMNLGHIEASSFHVGFKYTSTSQQAAAWQIDGIALTGNMQTYEVSSESKPYYGGVINGEQVYEYGQTASLTAEPAGGFEFVGWSQEGTVVSSDPTYAFDVYEDVALEAQFEMKADGAIVFNKDFDDQSLTSGGWTQHNVTGDELWVIPSDAWGVDDSYCAYINGYSDGQPNNNENWLISPAFNPSHYEGLSLSFWNAFGFSGPALQAFYTKDFSGDPATTQWTPLEDVKWHNGNVSWEWTWSGIVDLSFLAGDEVHIGFKYTSDTVSAAAWQLDEILLTGQALPVSAEHVPEVSSLTVYPNPVNDILFFSHADPQSVVTVYDISGKRVLKTRLNGNEVDVSGLDNGFYIVKVNTASYSVTTKFVKK